MKRILSDGKKSRVPQFTGVHLCVAIPSLLGVLCGNSPISWGSLWQKVQTNVSDQNSRIFFKPRTRSMYNMALPKQSHEMKQSQREEGQASRPAISGSSKGGRHMRALGHGGGNQQLLPASLLSRSLCPVFQGVSESVSLRGHFFSSLRKPREPGQDHGPAQEAWPNPILALNDPGEGYIIT